ncbi:hypothetical protein PsYK624_146460 [Phanerochaete sordida]|uniref:Uncharacterized protein n=1 Tax=Phanerochaete sordida TaxID=48140 RepID=A0A9P3GPD5_9APHY|nr:hypothetical protein PsYK624_146460 [Phanerochaete sordida]
MYHPFLRIFICSSWPFAVYIAETSWGQATDEGNFVIFTQNLGLNSSRAGSAPIIVIVLTSFLLHRMTV